MSHISPDSGDMGSFLLWLLCVWLQGTLVYSENGASCPLLVLLGTYSEVGLLIYTRMRIL